MPLIPQSLALTVIIHYLHNQTIYQDHTVLKFCGTGGKTVQNMKMNIGKYTPNLHPQNTWLIIIVEFHDEKT
jgi:hypothetical protein